MAKNRFLERLKRAQQPASQWDEVMHVIDDFCDAIQRFTHQALACEAVPGHLTSYGQEYRITLNSKEIPLQTGSRNVVVYTGPRDYVLLRIHVPATGYPAFLDRYDDNLTKCNSKAALERGLDEFLQQSATRDAILTLERSSRRLGSASSEGHPRK